MSCQDIYTGKGYLYKVSPSDFLDIEEAHAHGFAVATAYPNPGGNTLYIRTALKNASLEVYDGLGRMVHSQEITDCNTAVNAEAWPAGIYVWKVHTGASAGAKTLAETGKWVKE